jgi:hypothetical protein
MERRKRMFSSSGTLVILRRLIPHIALLRAQRPINADAGDGVPPSSTKEKRSEALNHRYYVGF